MKDIFKVVAAIATFIAIVGVGSIRCTGNAGPAGEVSSRAVEMHPDGGEFTIAAVCPGREMRVRSPMRPLPLG